MQKFGVRNGPVDRRRLSDQDKSAYNQSGAYGKRASAVKRVKAYRGDRAYQAKRPHCCNSSRHQGTGSYGRQIWVQTFNKQRNRQSRVSTNARVKALDQRWITFTKISTVKKEQKNIPPR